MDSILNYLKKIVDWKDPMLEFKQKVNQLIEKYLGKYGLIEIEYQEHMHTVNTQFCKIFISTYKNDIEMVLDPLLENNESSEYASIAIEHKHISNYLCIPNEIERQLQMLVEKYDDLLRGDFTNWPKEMP